MGMYACIPLHYSGGVCVGYVRIPLYTYCSGGVRVGYVRIPLYTYYSGGVRVGYVRILYNYTVVVVVCVAYSVNNYFPMQIFSLYWSVHPTWCILITVAIFIGLFFGLKTRTPTTNRSLLVL